MTDADSLEDFDILLKDYLKKPKAEPEADHDAPRRILLDLLDEKRESNSDSEAVVSAEEDADVMDTGASSDEDDDDADFAPTRTVAAAASGATFTDQRLNYAHTRTSSPKAHKRVREESFQIAFKTLKRQRDACWAQAENAMDSASREDRHLLYTLLDGATMQSRSTEDTWRDQIAGMQTISGLMDLCVQMRKALCQR